VEIYLADKLECRPIVRVRRLRPDGAHRALQGRDIASVRAVVRVELLHEIGCSAIVNVPKTKQQGMSSCVQQAANQPEQFVPSSDRRQTGRASAKRYQTGGQMELVEIVKTQVAIAQTDTREHGIILPEEAVRRDVDQGGIGALLAQLGAGRIATKKDLVPVQDAGDGLHLVEDEWCASCRDAKDQRRACAFGAPLLA